MTIVGILLFNEVEVLDFAGPFEVFSLTEKNKQKLFNVITISEKKELLTARNGLKIHSDYQFDNHPKLDILIVPGGYGAEHIEVNNQLLIRWIKKQHTSVKVLASVCTGALLLAACGLLDGKKATTHWMDLDRLENEYPKVEVIRGVKYVEANEIVTSAGISAGINMSFRIVKRLMSRAIAADTAKRMEYDINWSDI